MQQRIHENERLDHSLVQLSVMDTCFTQSPQGRDDDVFETCIVIQIFVVQLINKIVEKDIGWFCLETD